MSRPSEPELRANLSPPPSPEMSSSCAKKFVDQSDFESHILNAIRSASEPQVLVFTDVSSSWGERIVDLINETSDGHSTRKSYNSSIKVLRIRIMPTEVHDCCQDWWRVSEITLRDVGDLTGYEQAQIDVRVGTMLQFPWGPYTSSRKEPDLFVRSSCDRLPSFVIESGWSESWNALMNDMNLLLVGGNGDVRAVAILKWNLNRPTRLVSGFVELYVRDRNGIPVKRQREEIFPVPTETGTQRLELTRQEVFGPHLTPDPARTQSPNTILYLEIEDLRAVALRALHRMDLSPA
ncbi:hypothetical protein N7471_001561 [Penicillium samsonianum]|uniref:uncharacterized protein n=1 Tax=Penicillium samsonianum TaxID=1882272 RepID=UPI002547148A|nr:uncharacterized protein N7471_001561 [Penicillium samsonianum]KAJ6150362.1 hypothetical protein N7471_001561 [Penicillium samsonianum]